MQVAVVRLRYNGHKLPKDQLQQIPPIRGTLSIDRERDRYREQWVAKAWLLGDRHDPLIPTLRDARLVRLRGSAFVLVGLGRGGAGNDTAASRSSRYSVCQGGGTAARACLDGADLPRRLPWRNLHHYQERQEELQRLLTAPSAAGASQEPRTKRESQ